MVISESLTVDLHIGTVSLLVVLFDLEMPPKYGSSVQTSQTGS